MSGAEKIFLNKRHFFYPVKAQIIAFRATNINIVFSDIQHKNKESLIGE